MGVFASNIYRATEKGGGICIISQYVGRSPDSFVDAFYLKFTEIYREISQLVLKFAQESGVKVVVAMRSQISDKNYRDELAFYQSIFKDCEVSLRANDRRSMSSYQVGMDSDLIVSFDSTLLFELFGMGKKILCCGNADEEYQNVWSNVDGFGNKGQCERLPYDTLLDSWDYGDFTKKAKRLLKMNNDEFYDTTQDSRKWYMNFGDEYPHRIVYNAIQKKMSEKD